MSSFRIGTWNIGGTSFLRDPQPEDRARLSREINDLCHVHGQGLDVLLLQEVTTENGTPIFECPDGYSWHCEIVVDSQRHAHPRKWDELLKRQPPGTILGQGNAILWRGDLAHGSLWEPRRADRSRSLAPEIVRLDTGLYTGSRDSEPRVAMVARFTKDGRHIVVVNIHLTTLEHEREGSLERDHAGSVTRSRQVRLVLDGIVSAYNTWWWDTQRQNGLGAPVWIIGGDLNGIPESDEVLLLERARFFDICKTKANGTKRRRTGGPADLTLDYLFAGVIHHGLVRHHMPMMTIAPIDRFTSSDHFPIVSEIELEAP